MCVTNTNTHFWRAVDQKTRKEFRLVENEEIFARKH